MKKSNKLIIIIFAIVVSFALFIAESYYTIAILKKVTLNHNEIMTAIENSDNSSSGDNTEAGGDEFNELLKEGYTEENYKLVIERWNKLYEFMPKDDMIKACESLELLFEENPNLCPPEGYDIEKCKTDKWYMVSSILYLAQFDDEIKDEDIVPFNDFYYLSNSEEGQYELIQKFMEFINQEEQSEENQEIETEEDTVPSVEADEDVGTEVLGDFSEGKYSIVMSEFDEQFNNFSDKNKEMAGAQTETLLSYRKDLAPAQKYDPNKCKTDKWYLTTSLIILAQYRQNPNADIPTFDEYYNLSKTKEGQYELVTEFINVTQDGLNPEK